MAGHGHSSHSHSHATHHTTAHRNTAHQRAARRRRQAATHHSSTTHHSTTHSQGVMTALDPEPLFHISKDWVKSHKGEPIPILYGKMTDQEYVQDLEDLVLNKSPKFWPFLLFNIIPFAGMIVGGILFGVSAQKDQKKGNAIADAFNAKYSESRGVTLHVITSMTREYYISVKNPGVYLPGVALYTPSKDSLPAIQEFADEAASAASVTPDGKVIQDSTPGMAAGMPPTPGMAAGMPPTPGMACDPSVNPNAMYYADTPAYS